MQSLPRWAGKTCRASATEIPAYLLVRETCRSTPWQELVYGLCCPLGPWGWVRIVLSPPDSLLFRAHFTVSGGSSCSHFTAHISLSCHSSFSLYSPSSHPSLPFNDNLSHFLSLILLWFCPPFPMVRLYNRKIYSMISKVVENTFLRAYFFLWKKCNMPGF